MSIKVFSIGILLLKKFFIFYFQINNELVFIDKINYNNLQFCFNLLTNNNLIFIIDLFKLNFPKIIIR